MQTACHRVHDEDLARDGTRESPLQPQLLSDSQLCTKCGAPMTIIEAGQQYHPTCQPGEDEQ